MTKSILRLLTIAFFISYSIITRKQNLVYFPF